jgi:hypothetical protein
MSPAMHLAPLFALVTVTLLVWLSMLVQRSLHMRRNRISPEDMPTRAAADARFGDAQSTNNALMNLCELPVLFYVLWILLFVMKQNDALYLLLAWIFVGLRAVQALVHVTYNTVMHRGLAYLLSSLVLWAMWARAAGQFYLGLDF